MLKPLNLLNRPSGHDSETSYYETVCNGIPINRSALHNLHLTLFVDILAVHLIQSLTNQSLRVQLPFLIFVCLWDCQLSQFALPKALQTIRFANVLPFLIIVCLLDCQLTPFAVILAVRLTQSLTTKRFAFSWLFCFSSVYESELSPQPQNKKACHLRDRLCSETGI